MANCFEREKAYFLKSFSDDLKRLRRITDSCRPDMHEPDEQDVSARVVGTHLDNAFGDSVAEEAIARGYQEFVVILKRAGRKEQRFNLANLIALARMAKVEYPE